MTATRRLAYLALLLAYCQIVFGAIVRLSGSGLGCGEHWPTCNGYWLPPLDQPRLIIEVSHRYIAAALILTILALLLVTWSRRRRPGIAGKGGVLRPVGWAAALVVTAALFGAATVKLGLSPLVIVGHLTIAMSLLAVLAAAVIRAGGLGGARMAAETGGSSRKAARGSMAAAALALVVVILGALTANLPGANVACLGFPLCSGGMFGSLAHVQLTHRILAYLLALHLLGLTIGFTRRHEAPPVLRTVWVALGLVVLQVLIAGAMIGMHLPPVLRSAHEAVGTMLWLVLAILALLARRGIQPAGVVAGRGPAPAPREPVLAGAVEP